MELHDAAADHKLTAGAPGTAGVETGVTDLRDKQTHPPGVVATGGGEHDKLVATVHIPSWHEFRLSRWPSTAEVSARPQRTDYDQIVLYPPLAGMIGSGRTRTA